MISASLLESLPWLPSTVDSTFPAMVEMNPLLPKVVLASVSPQYQRKQIRTGNSNSMSRVSPSVKDGSGWKSRDEPKAERIISVTSLRFGTRLLENSRGCWSFLSSRTYMTLCLANGRVRADAQCCSLSVQWTHRLMCLSMWSSNGGTCWRGYGLFETWG